MLCILLDYRYNGIYGIGNWQTARKGRATNLISICFGLQGDWVCRCRSLRYMMIQPLGCVVVKCMFIRYLYPIRIYTYIC